MIRAQKNLRRHAKLVRKFTETGSFKKSKKGLMVTLQLNDNASSAQDMLSQTVSSLSSITQRISESLTNPRKRTSVFSDDLDNG